MKITGIIAEYNPFHNGHAYQIEQAKKNGADYIIIVMSGNFLQRGTPAILDKWTRAKMALSAGADLIIELPAVFATASAQYFARGGVSILDKLGCVDTISFGCESNDIHMIHELSSFLWKEPDSYKEKLQTFLKKGNSFPKARELALSSELSPEVATFASSPNNILALEYSIALLERGSNMNILPIERKGSGYHMDQIKAGTLPSATAIRKVLQSNNNIDCMNSSIDSLSDYVPKTVSSIIKEQAINCIYQDDFSLLLKYKLLSQGNSSFAEYADVSEDLSDKIHKNLRYYRDYTQFCELLKSKELTYSRINRALTHILLNITQDMYEDIKTNDYAAYERILGFKKSSKEVLSNIGKNNKIPLITKLTHATELLDSKSMLYLEHDIFCSHVYNSVVFQKTLEEVQNEYQKQIVIL